MIALVCRVHFCRVIYQKEKKKKKGPTLKGAGGLRGNLSTGSCLLPSRMCEDTDMHTQAGIHLTSSGGIYNVCVFTDVVTKQTAGYIALL